ncbi:hypothetical protein HMPREF3293_02621 [Christensenella minuta]|uniref:Uncharacterized protein n=1 Tax=Christensenella minuta TaxID=626937 RepID=A0A136Q1I3_9FIRM|nr:hypothetical protein HMPREF3293_02621 [Christensenella minuta]
MTRCSGLALYCKSLAFSEVFAVCSAAAPFSHAVRFAGLVRNPGLFALMGFRNRF